MNKTFLIMRQELITTFSRPSYLFFAFGLPVLAVLVLGGVKLFQGRSSANSVSDFSGPAEFHPESEGFIDHSGLIPYIAKLGFEGSIITTFATRDLCSIMLADCGKIQEYDTITHNKKRARQHLPPVEPIYTRADADQAMQYFVGIPYNKPFRITKGVKVTFTNTGHLLGAGVVNLQIKESGIITRIAFTGDVGRPVNRILRSPQDM